MLVRSTARPPLSSSAGWFSVRICKVGQGRPATQAKTRARDSRRARPRRMAEGTPAYRCQPSGADRPPNVIGQHARPSKPRQSLVGIYIGRRKGATVPTLLIQLRQVSTWLHSTCIYPTLRHKQPQS